MENENILVAWARKSKNGDKIVLNLDRDALASCVCVNGKVELMMNKNKVVGILQDLVEVCAVNQLTAKKYEMKKMNFEYRSE